MSEEFDLSSVPTNEAQADALIASVESPGEVNPPGPTPETHEALATKVDAPVPQALEPKYKIKWNGQERELPVNQLINLAQQGYGYSEGMRDLKVQRKLFEDQRTTEQAKWKDVSERIAQYREVEEYIKQDPQWWEHVRSQYQQQQTQGGPVNPVNHPVVKELLKTVEGLGSDLSQIKQEKVLAQQAQEDTQLDTAISGIKEAHPNLDWLTIDETGKSLEQRVIDYATQNNIGTFRAAFRDLMHDELVKKHEVKAKEEVAQNIKKATKLGLGPITDSPKSKLSTPKKGITWNSPELEGDAILKELGVA